MVVTDKEKSYWYALFLSIVKNMCADESLRVMGVGK